MYCILVILLTSSYIGQLAAADITSLTCSYIKQRVAADIASQKAKALADALKNTSLAISNGTKNTISYPLLNIVLSYSIGYWHTIQTYYHVAKIVPADYDDQKSLPTQKIAIFQNNNTTNQLMLPLYYIPHPYIWYTHDLLQWAQQPSKQLDNAVLKSECKGARLKINNYSYITKLFSLAVQVPLPYSNENYTELLTRDHCATS